MFLFQKVKFDAQYSGLILGVDEAGRGPLAGPVVAAAVMLDYSNFTLEVNDSKKLTRAQRETLYSKLVQSYTYGIGIMGVDEINNSNILVATKKAMHQAILATGVRPDHILIDGNQLPDLRIDSIYHKVVNGDNLSAAIAAASIIAKVTRDRLMQELAQKYNVYGWEKNAGYGTKFHLNAIQEFGLTPAHRIHFKPIRLAKERQAEQLLDID